MGEVTVFTSVDRTTILYVHLVEVCVCVCGGGGGGGGGGIWAIGVEEASEANLVEG